MCYYALIMSGNKFFRKKGDFEKREDYINSLQRREKGRIKEKTKKSKRNEKNIPREELFYLYNKEEKSLNDIAIIFRCSVNKVVYWAEKYKLERRSRSEATYIKRNPDGDPFLFQAPKTKKEAILFGIGIGLYWGEGTRAIGTNSVRLGNSDPILIRNFIKFLLTFFGVKKSDMKFGLQIFSDISENDALDFWRKKIRIEKKQFYKVIITPSRSIGTYRHKSRFGVLTVYYNNKRLKEKLISLLPM